MSPPLVETLIEYHKTFINPDSLASLPLQPPTPRPITIKPDSVSLSVTFVHVHKSLLSHQECIHPHRPSSSLHPPITTLHIQVINEAAPVCGIRSKVDLTVLVGFWGQIEVTGMLVTNLVKLQPCVYLSSLPVCSSRGRQTLTCLLIPSQTVNVPPHG